MISDGFCNILSSQSNLRQLPHQKYRAPLNKSRMILVSMTQSLNNRTSNHKSTAQLYSLPMISKIWKPNCKTKIEFKLRSFLMIVRRQLEIGTIKARKMKGRLLKS